MTLVFPMGAQVKPVHHGLLKKAVDRGGRKMHSGKYSPGGLDQARRVTPEAPTRQCASATRCRVIEDLTQCSTLCEHLEAASSLWPEE